MPRKTSKNKWISICCNEETTVIGGEEGTNHFQCNRCGHPCGARVVIPKVKHAPPNMTKEERFTKWAEEHPKEFKEILESYGVYKALKSSRMSDYVNLTDIRDGRSVKRVYGVRKRFTDEELAEMKKRQEKIYDYRMSGMTLDNIAKEMGVTRERIRQILIKHYPDAEFPKHQRIAHSDVTLVCQHKACGKDFTVKYEKRKRMYCSRKCWILGRGNKIVNKKQMTAKERKAWQNKNHHIWYNKNKDDPAFKLRIKEYNRRATERRREKSAARKETNRVKFRNSFKTDNPLREVLEAYARRRAKEKKMRRL